MKITWWLVAAAWAALSVPMSASALDVAGAQALAGDILRGGPAIEGRLAVEREERFAGALLHRVSADVDCRGREQAIGTLRVRQITVGRLNSGITRIREACARASLDCDIQKLDSNWLESSYSFSVSGTCLQLKQIGDVLNGLLSK